MSGSPSHAEFVRVEVCAAALKAKVAINIIAIILATLLLFDFLGAVLSDYFWGGGRRANQLISAMMVISRGRLRRIDDS